MLAAEFAVKKEPSLENFNALSLLGVSNSAIILGPVRSIIYVVLRNEVARSLPWGSMQ